jgi:hypothetical protein
MKRSPVYPIGHKFYSFEIISEPYLKDKVWRVDCKCVCGEIRHLRCSEVGKKNRQSCSCQKKILQESWHRKGTLAKNGIKICAKCGEEKTVDNFKSSGYTKDRLKQFCKRCGKDLELRQKYNLSINEYELLLKKQKGLCACCKSNKPNTPKSSNGYFVVDHCHKTNQIRGLLCFNCNTGIGKLGDESKKVLEAYEYLRRFEDAANRK